MSIEAHKPDLYRFKTDSQRRLSLEKDFVEKAPWLRATDGLIMIRGEGGGVAVLTNSDWQVFVQKYVVNLPEEIPLSMLSGDALARRSARLLSESWSITTEKWKDGGMRIKIPSMPTDLGIAPDAGEHAVIFVSGNLLEIWKISDWNNYCQANQ